MIHRNFQTRRGRKWHSAGGFDVCGHAALDGRTYEGPALGELVSSEAFGRQWPEVLRGLRGLFGIVRQDAGSLWAAVDHVRSLPIFYGRKGQDLYVSDDARWVRRQIGDEAADEQGRREFLMTGFVTGPSTLCPNVRQLQAGEALTARAAPDGLTVATQRYYRYVPGDWFDEDAERLIRRMDDVFVEAVERLVQRIGDRTIVVPLSAGYDSRAVVLLLHRLGRRNVVCFSYGAEGNPESHVSRRVAERLGYPWLFVPYSNARWAEWFDSQERRDYSDFADGLCSLPHIQDWPAVRELRREGKVPDDGVFVPGHTSISAWAIPESLSRPGRPGVEGVTACLRERYYKMQRRPGFDAQAWAAIDAKIRSLIGDLPCRTPDQAVAAYESWEWQELQAKYTTNACRAYEFYGYDWGMPLWHFEVMSFWRRVPLALRIGKALFKQYILRAGEKYGLPAKPVVGPSLRRTVKRIGTALGLGSLLRAADNLRQYDSHPLAFGGIVPPETYRELAAELRPFMTYMTREHLARILPRGPAGAA